jgi:phosphate starvation-inducible protein PhoH and related proteins
MTRGPRKRQLKPKTANQAEYIRTIIENDVTFCVGPAGTGKTSISVGLACEHLREEKVQKIIITRPVVESGRTGLGFLPGSFQEKIHPYLIPILEEMKIYLTSTLVKKYMSDGTIEIVPLEYMRGRNFHNCFMILDEAQNTTYEQIKMFITRIGQKSKAVVNGDIDQSDLPPAARGALEDCLKKLKDTDLVGIAELTNDDIIRNKIISKILSRL